MKQNYLKKVVTLEYNKELCSGCKMCTYVCPHGVFEVNERKAKIISRDNCMECGACQVNCPEGAITLQSGVGCATAILYSKLGKTKGEICCDGKC